ncbi:rubredoxin [bacterium]|nr:rubredoxin [bacterium]
MKNYLCTVCGYIYHPDENQNIEFEELSSTWVCPLCQAGKDSFEEIE